MALLGVSGYSLAIGTVLLPLTDPSPINHPLWSIAIEWQRYLVLPVLLVLRRRFGRLR